MEASHGGSGKSCSLRGRVRFSKLFTKPFSAILQVHISPQSISRHALIMEKKERVLTNFSRNRSLTGYERAQGMDGRIIRLKYIKRGIRVDLESSPGSSLFSQSNQDISREMNQLRRFNHTSSPSCICKLHAQAQEPEATGQPWPNGHLVTREGCLD